MANKFGEKYYWKVDGLDKRIKEYIESLSLMSSNSWIPYVMVHVDNKIWCTERQARWIQTMVKVKVKKDITFTRLYVGESENPATI